MGRSVPEVMAELAATGLSPYQLALVTELAVASASSGHPADKRAEKLRAYDRERKRKSRGCPAESSGHPADISETPLISSSLPSVSINEGEESKEGRKEERPRKKSSGHPLPDGWQPHARHYATAEALGLNRSAVDGLAEDMRQWAKAEAHRAVTLKSDWDATFYKFIRSEAAKRTKPGRPLTPNEQQKARSDDALAKLKEYNRNLADAGGPDDRRDVPENHSGRPRNVFGWAGRTAEPLPAGGNCGGSRPREWDRNETHVLALAGRNQG